MNDDASGVESVCRRGHDTRIRVADRRHRLRACPSDARAYATRNNLAMLHGRWHPVGAAESLPVNARCNPVSRPGNPIVRIARPSREVPLLEPGHLRTIDHIPIHEPDQPRIVIDVKLLEAAPKNLARKQIGLVLQAIKFQILEKASRPSRGGYHDSDKLRTGDARHIEDNPGRLAADVRPLSVSQLCIGLAGSVVRFRPNCPGSLNQLNRAIAIPRYNVRSGKLVRARNTNRSSERHTACGRVVRPTVAVKELLPGYRCGCVVAADR